MFDNLHLLQAEFLYLLIPVWSVVVWLISVQDSTKVWKKNIDATLLPYLLDNATKTVFKTPIQLGVVMSLMILALASPAWKIKPQSASNEISEVVWVLNVSKSMQSRDLMPTRMKRAIFKMDDFLAKRVDIRSALVAYYGSAHLVMPLTKDRNIINSFASSLSPDIMPLRGDALYDALKLASKQFIEVDGTIVVLSDAIEVSVLKKIKADKALQKYKIIFYNITSPALKKESMRDALQISFDDSDIKQLSDKVDHQFNSFQTKKKGQYENGGFYLLPIILFLLMFWFRRGFIGELWRVD